MWNEYGYNVNHLSNAYEYEDLLTMLIKSDVAAHELRSMMHDMKRTSGTMYSYIGRVAEELEHFHDAVMEAKALQFERELDSRFPELAKASR